MKMTSQLVIFRAFFRPPDPKSEKKSRKSTNKKILALVKKYLFDTFDWQVWGMFRLYDFTSFFENFGFDKSSIEMREKGRECLNKFFDKLSSQYLYK